MKTSRKPIVMAIVQLIWCTLDDTCQYLPLTEPGVPTLMGSYQIPHFDAKGDADDFLQPARVRRVRALSA